jgi:hypothetical protein
VRLVRPYMSRMLWRLELPTLHQLRTKRIPNIDRPMPVPKWMGWTGTNTSSGSPDVGAVAYYASVIWECAYVGVAFVHLLKLPIVLDNSTHYV